MPRFDHMKGEVSVRNLVCRQGERQFSPYGGVGTKSTQTLLQPPPVLDAETKHFMFPIGPHPQTAGGGGRWGEKEFRSETAGVKEALEETSPLPHATSQKPKSKIV